MSEETKILPKGWKLTKLGEAANVLNSLRKPISTSERNKRIENKPTSELYPYYGATGQVGWIDGFLSDGEYILLGEDGAPFFDIGKSKAYEIKGKAWVNNHAHVLDAMEGVTFNRFLLHYLNTFNYKGYVNGTTRLKLTKGNLVRIPVPLPPLPTQEAIVAKIETLFSELDNGIAQLKTAQQQLDTYRQSVLKWAFEGKLTNKNVKDGELPKGWEWVKLGDVAEVNRGKSKHRPRNDKKLFGGNYPFIQTGDVKAANGGQVIRYSQSYSEFGLQQSKLWPKGTLCLTIAANIADTAFLGIDACFPDSIVGIVPIENKLNLKYTNYLIQKLKVEIDSNASATAQKNINKNFLDNLVIPYCTTSEQQQIVQEIESRLSVADKLQETITTSLAQAESLRQSILKQAFEGKLV